MIAESLRPLHFARITLFQQTCSPAIRIQLGLNESTLSKMFTDTQQQLPLSSMMIKQLARAEPRLMTPYES